MRYKISENVNKYFFTTSNLNLIFTRHEDDKEGYIETEGNPNIHESEGVLYFSDNDNDKPVTDTRIVVPSKIITKVHLSPYRGDIYLNNLWLKELKIILADDNLEAVNLRLRSLEIMSGLGNLDISLLGSITDYDFGFDVSKMTLQTQETDEVVHPEEKGIVRIKNRGRAKVLFKGNKI